MKDQFTPEKIRNIGIFAHVDAGKTTLTEQMLLACGAIRTAGSVDKGTAHTDSLPVEQRRGISVQAACVGFTYRDTRINLIDTPGHADFSSEIERSLWALDGAVLIISAPDGVEPQTELLFNALRKQKLPAILFVNKMDREGADLPGVMDQIRRRLSPAAALLFEQGNSESGKWNTDELIDTLASVDDDLMERYLEDGDIPRDVLLDSARRNFQAGSCFPVLCGSAIRGDGIEALLDAVIEYLPSPETGQEKDAPLCAAVFGITPAGTMGRGAMAVRLAGYRECPAGKGARMPRRGVDPLDTSKYILAARSALEGGIFD